MFAIPTVCRDVFVGYFGTAVDMVHFIQHVQYMYMYSAVLCCTSIGIPGT